MKSDVFVPPELVRVVHKGKASYFQVRIEASSFFEGFDKNELSSDA